MTLVTTLVGAGGLAARAVTAPGDAAQVTIRDAASKLCLDGAGREGDTVRMRACDGSAGQRWTRSDAGGGSVLVDAANGLALDDAGFSREPGARVIVWSRHGNTNQQWSLQADGVLQNAYSRLALAARGGRPGARVVQAPLDARGTRWQIEPVDGAAPSPSASTTAPPATATTPATTTAPPATPAAVTTPATTPPAPATPAPATPADGTSGPPGGTAGWHQTFGDEFSGDLDAAKWHRGWACGNGQPDTCFFYDRMGTAYPDGNATVSGGELNLRTAHESRDGQAWTSGAVSTAGRFSQKYGYFEVRMKPDSRNGGDPDFWLANAKSWPPEIDIAEVPGAFGGTTVGSPILHAEGSGNDASRTTKAPSGSYDDAFHTFGLLWEPGKLTGYIDGKVVNTISSAGVPTKDMYVVLSDEVHQDGGAWFGTPDADTSTRTTKVDWVHVWQHD